MISKTLAAEPVWLFLIKTFEERKNMKIEKQSVSVIWVTPDPEKR